MAGLGRDLAAAAATLETVAPGEDRELVAELLGGVETKMGHLVTASTQYGKLKVASLDTLVTPVDTILAPVRGDSVPEAGPAADVRRQLDQGREHSDLKLCLQFYTTIKR